MTRFVMMHDRIYDLDDGSLITDHPIYRKNGHSIWSAEALLEDIESMTAPTFLKPFYFLDVID